MISIKTDEFLEFLRDNKDTDVDVCRYRDFRDSIQISTR
jgi:hypothetical protein